MTTQNKMITQRLGGFIKYYMEEHGFKPSTLNCVRWAYEQGKQDPSRSEALDKVLEEVEESLSSVVSAELRTFGSLSDSTHVGEAILNCEKVLLKLREIRKG